jgi:hypothetical protein
MDSCNISINLVLAVTLSLAPFFTGSDVSADEIRKTYIEAQKQADHIVKTGDMSALAGMEQSFRLISTYQAGIEAVPVLKPLVERATRAAFASLIPPAK